MSATGFHGYMEEFRPETMKWDNYVRKLKFYLVANRIDTEEQKKAILLTVLGEQSVSTLVSLIIPKQPEELTFDEIISKLRDHYCPAINDAIECFHFYNRFQKERESIIDFSIAIRKLAQHCGFTDLDKQLRIRLICGIRDEGLQRKLLTEKGLSFEKTLEIAKAYETATRNVRDIHSNVIAPDRPKSFKEKDNADPILCKVGLERQPNAASGKNSLRYAQPPKINESISTACFRCGGIHNPQACIHVDTICRYCKKKGHLLRVCKTRQKISNKKAAQSVDSSLQMSARPQNNTMSVKQLETSSFVDEPTCVASTHSDAPELFAVMPILSAPPPMLANILLDGRPCVFEIDSGAAFSIMSNESYETLWPENRPQIQETDTSLRLWNKKQLPLKGEIRVQVKFNDRCADQQRLLIADQGGRCLLGRNWFAPLGITVEGLNSMTQQKTDWLATFPILTDKTLGPIKTPALALELKNNSIPVFKRARNIPLPLKDKVNQAIQDLVDQGTLSPIQHSDWATPIVPVVKRDGTLRICMDYRITVNPVLKPNTYPLPIISELLTNLAGGTVFSRLDLAQAYLQLPMDEASSKILTVNTPKGLFKVNRLPFGLTASPGIFQRFMEQLLTGIDGIAIYLDDVIISGRSVEEHNSRLNEVLSRMANANLRLNPKKCVFAVDSMEVLGFRVHQMGISPTEEKVRAIHEAPIPQNKAELQAFLGLLNFYNAFLHHKATVAEPLHRLLDKGTPWKFGPAELESFNKVKALLGSSDVLVHYDPSKRLILTCDASAVGVGAVLSLQDDLGRDRPIAFASRTLSKAERNYAQIDREGLAIIFGVKKFHTYIYGRHVLIRTDHKPLLGLLSPTKPIPLIIAPRMLRWNLLLSAYSYELTYVPGRSIMNADALSRLPSTTTNPDETMFPDPCDVYMIESDDIPISLKEIQEGTRQDPLLFRVFQNVMKGDKPEGKEDARFLPFARKFDELSIQKECLLWGSRVVIPQQLQQRVLEELHSLHPGIVAMKSLARAYVWWPNIDHDISDMVAQCEVCQLSRHLPPRVPSTAWKPPPYKWARIHIDMMMSRRQNFLIVVDSFTKWLEIVVLESVSSFEIASALRRMFAMHGLPETVVTDNGSVFTSSELAEFFIHNGIHHIRIPPFHPSTNGQVERYVQTVKDALMRMKDDDIRNQVSRYLFHQHTTPNSTTKKTPAEMLLGRQLRTSLNLLHPQNAPTSPRPETQSVSVRRSFQVNEPVYMHKPLGPEKWVPARVLKKLGSLMYQVVDINGTEHIRHVNQLRRRAKLYSATVRNTPTN